MSGCQDIKAHVSRLNTLDNVYYLPEVNKNFTDKANRDNDDSNGNVCVFKEYGETAEGSKEPEERVAGSMEREGPVAGSKEHEESVGDSINDTPKQAQVVKFLFYFIPWNQENKSLFSYSGFPYFYFILFFSFLYIIRF